MIDYLFVFLLGPVFFLYQVFAVGVSQMNFVVFVVSGLGTAFWVAVISAIAGGTS